MNKQEIAVFALVALFFGSLFGAIVWSDVIQDRAKTAMVAEQKRHDEEVETKVSRILEIAEKFAKGDAEK
jgi:hypothetical protein